VLLGRLGLIPFDQAVALEEELCGLRYDGRLPDTILLMEHPPIVTLGRFCDPKHVLISPEEMTRRDIALAHSKRGGDTTFHAPGQLVLHTVMDLRRREGVLRGFVTDLEEVALRTLMSYGVAAERWSEHPGLWVSGQQIGAIGLHLSRGISSHGLALNIDPDLSSFDVINLCGLPGKKATSVSREIGRRVNVKQAAGRMERVFAEVFRVRLLPVTRAYLTKLAAEMPGSREI